MQHVHLSNKYYDIKKSLKVCVEIYLKYKILTSFYYVFSGGLGTLKIPLLSDLTHKISLDYGVYLSDQGHTLRGLFIIDKNSVLRQITMNDLPVGRSVDETLRLVQAFQYTDEKGEVCPAGWKPGQDTVSPLFFFWIRCCF